MNGECRYHDCLSGGVHPSAVSPFVATLRQTAASAQTGILGGALIVVQQPDLQ